MPRILLVDDDLALLEVLGGYLRRCGYDVDVAASEGEAEAMARESPPDLILLDVMMPDVDGWQFLRSLRRDSTVPVIMLTAKSAEGDVLRGFGLGADDYVAKPFSFAQLEARVKALLGRAGRVPPGNDRLLVAGPFTLDLDAHRLMRGREVIRLTPIEFRLLERLMRRPGKVLSPEQLVVEIWGSEFAGEVGYVRRHIWRLRQKLEDDPANPRYVQNERNVGYFFNSG